jgi:hypothetical protein
MNMKDEYEHVHEEIWYVSQNNGFQEEMRKIRSTYKIPSKNYQGTTIDWIESHWALEEKNKFSDDVKNLLLRCKGAKGESWFVFNPTITSYILTGLLEPAFYGLPHEIEDVIKIRKLDNKIEVTLLLGYDSTKKQINEILKVHWKTIEKLQKGLAGNKIRKSEDFELKQFFWEGVKNQGKTEIELSEDSRNDEKAYDQYLIKKIIKAMDTRIASSFE